VNCDCTTACATVGRCLISKGKRSVEYGQAQSNFKKPTIAEQSEGRRDEHGLGCYSTISDVVTVLE
jgi:hypothetical protein